MFVDRLGTTWGSAANQPSGQSSGKSCASGKKDKDPNQGKKHLWSGSKHVNIHYCIYILYIYICTWYDCHIYIYWYCHISYCFPEGTMRTMMTISLPRSSGFHQGTRPMAKSFLGLFGRLAVLSSSFCQCRPGTDSVIGVAMVWVDHKYKCKRVECNYEHISAPVGWRFHSFDMFWLILCMKEPPAA